MIEERIINQSGQSSNQKETPPTLTRWKDSKMIRRHSLRSAVQQVLEGTIAYDLIKIGIIGEPGTGKTTLAGTIAHLAHKMSKEQKLPPFAVRSFGKEQFLNLKETLNNLTPANYILKFEDLSFLMASASKKTIDQVKQVVTEIRHLKKDVKIILIYDYHYSLGLDKYLRQSNFKFFTSMGSSENDNMLKLVGTKYQARVTEFTKMVVEMTLRHKATFKLGKKNFFIYPHMKPFVPCLFYNNERLRYVVFPKREWLDPICSICVEGDTYRMKSELSVPKFVQNCKDKLGIRAFETAVRLRCFANGINVYSKSTDRASKFLDQAFERVPISLEEVVTEMGLKVDYTNLRKKVVDEIMTNS